VCIGCDPVDELDHEEWRSAHGEGKDSRNVNLRSEEQSGTRAADPGPVDGDSQRDRLWTALLAVIGALLGAPSVLALLH
jgi:hypothetical protein